MYTDLLGGYGSASEWIPEHNGVCIVTPWYCGSLLNPFDRSIAQENKLGQRYIAASDFLKNGIPASILATIVIVTVGFGISRALK